MGERLSKAQLHLAVEKQRPGFIVSDIPEKDSPIPAGIDRTPELEDLKRMWGVGSSSEVKAVQVVTIPDAGSNGPGPKIKLIIDGEIGAYQG